MKIYFLSSRPCSLSINGVFYGITDTFERSAELSLSDRIYAQFAPEGAHPIGFFLTEELSQTAPEGCDVYLLKDGIAIYAHDFPPIDFTLHAVAQVRQGDVLVTVFRQGNLQLCINTPQNVFNAYIPPFFEPCSIQFHGDFLLLRSDTHVGVFTQEGQPLLIEKVLDCTFVEDGLRATLPLSDSLGRVADCRWRLSENNCTLTEFTLRQPSQKQTLPDGLIAFAFFESVLFKANFREFLSDELQSEAEQILSFLGDFTAVTLTKNEKECGLVRKKSLRLYELSYFSVEVENGKIVDVRG